VRARASGKDYYKILGLTPAATPAEVKKAYRKLAFEHHPDRNPGDPQAAARFIEIAEAYETLGDPERRRSYDRTYQPSSAGAKGATGSAPPPPVVPAASTLLKALEDIWAVIRRHHPEVPAVVIIIASGTGGRHAKWGHHAPGRWHNGSAEHAEVMISGEGLHRAPREVLATLLHEAAHALADARGITDTSRQGRYHNRKFAQLATELGLDVTENDQFGWSSSTVTETTARRYADGLALLTAAMTIWRNSERTVPTGAKRNTNLIPASCPCDRTIRVAASTLREAPITCQACDGKFEPKNPADA
jgi:curved DNA-binding protein CbpA